MKITIRPAQPADAFKLAVRLDDAFEVFEWSGRTPQEALTRAIALCPMAWTVEGHREDGSMVLLAVFGCGPTDDPAIGCPWLLSSKEAHTIPKTFLKANRKYIALMQEHYPTLVNYVYSRNPQSICWLQHLGFTFGHSVTPPGSTSTFITFKKTHV
jgi:hypothetical protein